MSPTLVHFRSVPYTAIGFFQTPLSPVTPLLTACLPVSWVTGFLSTHLLGNMPCIQKTIWRESGWSFLLKSKKRELEAPKGNGL